MPRFWTEYGLYPKFEFWLEADATFSLSIQVSFRGGTWVLIIPLPRAEVLVTSILLLSLKQVQMVVFSARNVRIPLKSKSMPRCAQTGVIWLTLKWWKGWGLLLCVFIVGGGFFFKLYNHHIPSVPDSGPIGWWYVLLGYTRLADRPGISESSLGPKG